MGKTAYFAVTTAALVLVSATACNDGVMTSHANRELGAWMKDYWSWSLGGPGTAHVGDAAMLPMPDATDPDGDGTFTGAANVELSTQDTFVLPMFVWVGETYGGARPDDDPATPARATFLETNVVVMLDGRTILDSSEQSLDRFYFDTQRFDAAIDYASRAADGATGAIWVKGIGFLHVPLPAGTHTLHLVERNLAAGVGYDDTWTLTVH